ncbi:Transposase and inactivated derivatives, TnpA family [Priestia filamentosa]|nr:Tn3 family transposase [Priestia filamentosa]SMF75017.1 Transposase and inactivated derivatives, TnpA family [Priestia filamentosa]
MRGKELLTPDQRLEWMAPPHGDGELAIHYTFSQYDLEIINRHRRDYNRLGFAIQLALVRYPGWSLTDIKVVPGALLNYVANQIDIDPDIFPLYARRENTLWDHLKEIRQEYGFTTFTTNHYRQLLRYLFSLALENGNTAYLIDAALNKLRRLKIILPAITTIERVVWEARHRAEERIYQQIFSDLTSYQKQKLDKLIKPVVGTGKTTLGWLKETTGQFSPDAFLKVIERLEYIRRLKLQIDTKGIHSNRLRQLSRLGARYEPQSFRRFHEAKRYTILVTYLLDLTQNLVDQAFDIHNKQILTLQSKGRRQQEELQKLNGKAVNEKVVHYANLGKALIKARNEGLDPFVLLETVMPWEKFIESIDEAKKLSRPLNYDYLDLLASRFNYLRKYTPTLLKTLEFRSTKSAEPLIRALHTIQNMNDSGKRKVPEGAPLDFLSNRWRKHVLDTDGTINRQYYEMAALTELRNYVRSGDISIVGSKQYKEFDEYLVAPDEWKNIRSSGTRLAVPSNVDEYLEERMTSLLQRLNWVSDNIDTLEGVNIEKGRLHIQKLEKGVPEEAKQFSATLYSLLPRIKLTDLLLEVASWTEFDQQFIHASTNKSPNSEERSIVLAALMAMGTNIGLTKMADATPGISYYQMANASQWRMYDDVMSRAQATLVNFHHRRSLSSYWGDGSTSSSDGMRVQVGVSSLSADPNPHYGSGKGATIYRLVSDQFSSFYTKVINTNARDAVHVIDGLLHHESDLSIEEHYTDTAGYTDQVFGLAHLLGFRFAPRLRDLSDSKLYVIGKPSDFPKIENLLRGQIDIKVIRENYNDVLRLAHSIREGEVSGALIMGKLGSYARQNKVAKALREMGRIGKTIFILDYISNKSMRRRIQRGLNWRWYDKLDTKLREKGDSVYGEKSL